MRWMLGCGWSEETSLIAVSRAQANPCTYSSKYWATPLDVFKPMRTGVNLKLMCLGALDASHAAHLNRQKASERLLILLRAARQPASCRQEASTKWGFELPMSS